ncbi:MAG: hydroxymethylbilane synthase [Sulfuricurvum sp.]|uniref:hydroxymethylbilane synthase n=1 Tax=Sulfuricurvum sp. TaxID=2025608 RepID=UPI00271ABD21|nr:hydroxymethylbilane synthase [Sulfuricurvum sp.]MDO9056020.1 hydroxymethylbilane synthase [Sulfuricurvum sp.]MDP2851747.1 hydroxymethylbilane synthase [Sulfuricurvum sp.]MDP3292656.1 hydroxymethylbilane synthase [Sulfuricurvum sp.]
MKKLTIATRGSKLALWQSNHIKSVIETQFRDVEVELKIIITSGDKILDVPLAKIGGKGLFLKEIEESMLRGEAQMAVHSLKDVPTVMPEGLLLSAITLREDVRDAMLSEKYPDIMSLPQGAIVGTSSLRRRMQLVKQRPDLVIKDLRGNVDTRIRKLKEGEFDAIILAAAGINRLGFSDLVEYFYPISLDEMLPAMGQGALGIETVNEPWVLEIASFLEDENSRIETTIERGFVDTLQGGCQVPIGVSARVQENGDVIVRSTLGMPDGSEVMGDEITVSKQQTKRVGEAMAERLIAQGAMELLQRAEAMANEG